MTKKQKVYAARLTKEPYTISSEQMAAAKERRGYGKPKPKKD